nr:MAG: hypothetical protein BECKLPF1236C_GA0070990_100033 [Candidatus Kentron sp. LPFa]
MTEKAQQETDKTATGSDNTWEVIDRLEKDARDFFLGDPSPPGAESTAGKDPEPQFGQRGWLKRSWDFLWQVLLSKLFWFLLLSLSWALSTVGFYVLFSTWSIETPFGIDVLIGQFQTQWKEANSWGQLLEFWGRLVLSMFFAFLGAFLVGRMSRSMVRRGPGPGTRLISFLLLAAGLLLSGMSGFVVIWSHNNHEALLKDHRAMLDRSLDAAIKDVRYHYAREFKGKDGKSEVLRQERERLGRIEGLFNKIEGFQARIDEYDSDDGEFRRFLRFLRAIGSDQSQGWIRRNIEDIYRNPNYRNEMLRHLLGEGGKGGAGFGRETTVLIGKMTEEWIGKLHDLCEDIASDTRSLKESDPESCASLKTDIDEFKQAFRTQSVSLGKQPNIDWLTGEFLDELKERIIGFRLRNVKDRLSRFDSLLKQEKQFDTENSSDKYRWIDFDDEFQSRRKSIDAHKEEKDPDFDAAFEKLKKLSSELARLLGETPHPVASPEPQYLHAVVRERFFTTVVPFVNAYHVPERYLNEKNLVTDPATDQIIPAKLIMDIEAVNETMPFSREELVIALEDRLGRLLPPHLRVQLLGVAKCGSKNDCEERIGALKKEYEKLAEALEKEPENLAEALEKLGWKSLAEASAGDIENRLEGTLTNRERMLLRGVIEKQKITANNEWFAYILAALCDILAIFLGIFDEMRKRGKARWPDHFSRKKRVQRQARREWEKQERELWQRWENIRRTSREHFIGRCDDFDLEKQKRWKARLETDDGGIETRIDAAIEQDLVLMATGIPGAEMNSLAKVAAKLSDVYRGIAKAPGRCTRPSAMRRRPYTKHSPRSRTSETCTVTIKKR